MCYIVKTILNEIDTLCKSNNKLIIAIDGRCASGKTTLALQFQKILKCNVIHMDHFFLRPHQRTKERLSQTGENIDHERFLQEVLIPLYEGNSFSYYPYNCHIKSYNEPIKITPSLINIVEGSYSCHSELWNYYDLHIFLDVAYDKQLKRIKYRNGDIALNQFIEKWIPLEEAYFNKYNIKEKCELKFIT